MHPEIPEAGTTLEELFAGRGIIVSEVVDHLKKVAADCGLPFGDRTRTFNSRRAQELTKWAESIRQGKEFRNAAFRAYFVEGLNIGKIDVLIELVKSIGLDGEEAKRVLENGSFGTAVDLDWAHSRALAITAVPSFNARGRKVVGAQPYEVLEKLIT